MIYLIILGSAALLALLVSFVCWLRSPWRCWAWFDIFWNYPDREGDEVPCFRIIWIGWLTIVWETPKGWRGWSVSLFTD
jgi:hypothetical protein